MKKESEAANRISNVISNVSLKSADVFAALAGGFQMQSPADVSRKPAIVCEEVSAGYGSGKKEKEILHSLSFTIKEGQCCALLGQNGCGKTTLLRTLTGLLPYNGEIRICGENLRKMNRKQIAEKMAMLTQLSEVYFSFTVRETVEMGRYVRGIHSSHDREKIDECLELTGLEDMEDKQIGELSGGQMQRVFLVRTIAQETPIILLDEPMNHLDLRYQVRLMEYLETWAKGETALPDGRTYRNTLIGVCHDITMAAGISDYLIFIREGRIAAMGDKREVLTRDVLKSVYGIDVAEYMKRGQAVQNELLFGKED